jgi:hypothetical protein
MASSAGAGAGTGAGAGAIAETGTAAGAGTAAAAAPFQPASLHIPALQSIVGPQYVLCNSTDQNSTSDSTYSESTYSDMQKYVTDWTGGYTGGSAVALPANTQQVSALLRYCNQHRIGKYAYLVVYTIVYYCILLLLCVVLYTYTAIVLFTITYCYTQCCYTAILQPTPHR